MTKNLDMIAKKEERKNEDTENEEKKNKKIRWDLIKEYVIENPFTVLLLVVTPFLLIGVLVIGILSAFYKGKKGLAITSLCLSVAVGFAMFIVAVIGIVVLVTFTISFQEEEKDFDLHQTRSKRTNTATTV